MGGLCFECGWDGNSRIVVSVVSVSDLMGNGDLEC
jgi:hypothetical protein